MNSHRETQNRKSWTQLSFKNQYTRQDLLAQDQALSHRVYRITLTLLFAAGVTFLVGFGRGDLGLKWIPIAGLVLLIHGALFLLIRHYHREVLAGVRSFVQLFLLVGCTLLFSWVIEFKDWPAFLMPLPLFSWFLLRSPVRSAARCQLQWRYRLRSAMICNFQNCPGSFHLP